jgi:PAS domain-containing protein
VRLVEAFESSESIVALLSADDGRFIEVNPAFYQITGYTPAQVIGHIPIDVGLWADLEFRAQLWESLPRRAPRGRCGGAGQLRRTAACSTASCTWSCCRARARRSLFCLLQICPTTIRRCWRAHESLYRELFLSASEGIYRSLPGGGFLDVNPAMARMLGYDSPAEFLLAYCDRARDIYVDQDMDAADNARLLRDGRIDQLRSRCTAATAAHLGERERARDPRRQGQPIFFEGSLEDITAQVEAEQALKQSQALYQVLLDNTRDGVFLIQRGLVRFANKAMADILGYRWTS